MENCQAKISGMCLFLNKMGNRNVKSNLFDNLFLSNTIRQKDTHHQQTKPCKLFYQR